MAARAAAVMTGAVRVAGMPLLFLRRWPRLTRAYSVFALAFVVRDVAWVDREGMPLLLLATDVGLYEMPLQSGATPVQVLVTGRDQDMGFYSVTVASEARGQVSVAVAAQQARGVLGVRALVLVELPDQLVDRRAVERAVQPRDLGTVLAEHRVGERRRCPANHDAV